VTLPAFAAERRAAAPLLLSACCTAYMLHGARSCRSISSTRKALSSKPAAVAGDRWDRRMKRWKLER